MTQEQKNALILILDFVERWNKEDRELEVANAAIILEELINN